MLIFKKLGSDPATPLLYYPPIHRYVAIEPDMSYNTPHMSDILLIANIVVASMIVGFILLQGRGAGLGSAWGGGGETFQTRRGVEKVVMRLTVGFIVVFFALSVASLLIKK